MKMLSSGKRGQEHVSEQWRRRVMVFATDSEETTVSWHTSLAINRQRIQTLRNFAPSWRQLSGKWQSFSVN
ncbi:hypothetical protein ANCCAN_29651 [Ancylostoma caninum]|uniref:Uncharacterized protein n=1 Tax=Ancylostoma caninum TaxID=29170 RepID=A0A368F0U2_ANCCA|nr:hypothetical protein ANCCAN_29651 [Ancylostoma caninum]